MLDVAQATADEFTAQGVEAKAYAANVASFADAEATVAQVVKDFGSLDILVNNAGITRDTLMLRMTEEDFDKAVETAFNAGNQIMCEKFVKGRELACSVIEHKGKMMVLPLTEIVSKNEFFDYEAKYTSGKSDEITPAALDEAEEIEVKATSAMLYERFGCKGFARFDYILNEEGLFFIEVNIVPGMSEASIMPKQAAEMGIPLSRLFGMTLENIL
jgi:D-alanine-D-alanine ligase